MVHECNDGPVRGDMAIRTFTRCQHMTGRLRGCPDQSAVGVTTGTGGIGWTEGRADMTAVTGDIRMCTVENESRTEMVEWLLR